MEPIRRYFADGELVFDANVWDYVAYYYIRDHLGSVRAVTNEDGAVVARYDYDPYGKPRLTWHSGELDPLTYQPIQFDFLFTGHLYHAKSGLYFAPFRAYDPELGRWISRDPIHVAGGINLYEYVGGDPVNAVDPWGLVGPSGAAIGAVVGFVGGVSGAVMVALLDDQKQSFTEVLMNAGTAGVGGAVSGAIVGATGGMAVSTQIMAGAGAGTIVGAGGPLYDRYLNSRLPEVRKQALQKRADDRARERAEIEHAICEGEREGINGPEPPYETHIGPVRRRHYHEEDVKAGRAPKY